MDSNPSDSPGSRRVLTPRLVALLAVVAAIVAVPGGRLLKSWLWPEPLPVMVAAPAFALTDQDARPYESSALAGRVWVANFIFTRCPSVCPALTRAMREVQDRTAESGDRVRLVSFSIDPDHDTPERLAEYAAQHGADPARWRFLTGPREVVEDEVAAGFQVGVTGTGPDLVPEQVVHGSLLVLVDARGQVRGYYDSAVPGGLDALVTDALRLAREASPSGAGQGGQGRT